ncbi:MAG: TetR/AcrR family transcriptional regulator [Myxococcota bacterium]|nr:TetR/AcrR family transcriptional regulator [Myxococcota bacterium]
MSAPRVGEKRLKILDAAVKVFAERGFYNARVSDIAAAAGVADGTIYLYFKNKDDLLIQVFEDRMDEILTTMRERLSAEDSALERLRILIHEHLALVESDPALAAVLSVELRQSSKFVRDYKARKFSAYLSLIEDVFDEGTQQGHFRLDLFPKLHRRAVFGALDEIVSFWVTLIRQGQSPPCTLVEAGDHVFELFVSGIRETRTELTDRRVL